MYNLKSSLKCFFLPPTLPSSQPGGKLEPVFLFYDELRKKLPTIENLSMKEIY
jgi:hypothetical protein